jgi:hypothetical protein
LGSVNPYSAIVIAVATVAEATVVLRSFARQHEVAALISEAVALQVV